MIKLFTSSVSPEAFSFNSASIHLFYKWQICVKVSENIKIHFVPNARNITWCHIGHMDIFLSLLFCFNIIAIYRYMWVNISSSGTPLHSGVNLEHFKVHILIFLLGYETYNMKLTCWPSWTWDCLLEHSICLMQIKLSFIFISPNSPWNTCKIYIKYSNYFQMWFWYGSFVAFLVKYYHNFNFVYIGSVCSLMAHTLRKGLVWNYKKCGAQPWISVWSNMCFREVEKCIK